MSLNVAQKLIQSHLVHGDMEPGAEIGIRIDQTLTQDATGTLVMLELEAMGLDRVKTEVSVQYVDHNIIQEDYKNPDDHLFLRSACQRFGVWYSRPGNGVSHPCHQENFGKPGKTLLGSDSHTPAGGAIGMLAIGAGGLEVALAMAGEPFFTRMPRIWGVKLTGRLPDWVSAKDVILEMLRRHGVDGGLGRIVEYYGPGLATLSAMDRHVIANMGAEMGATTTVFPSDQEVRRFLRGWQREEDWVELAADTAAAYDMYDEIAMPSSPGNVRKVCDVAGERIYQAYIGSSANPGYRDFAVSAMMVQGRRVNDRVSFDINPTSRAQLETLMRDGHVAHLLHAGARLHQAGCNGCIGMGQAPATDEIEVPVLLKVADDISTDEIMPPGLRVLPFRSNIPRIAEFSFDRIDPTYAARAREVKGHVVVGGRNYGQGSSREHAALGPQYLGLRAVLAKGFARIHSQNLINFGVLPLTFVDLADYDGIQVGDVLRLTDLRRVLTEGDELVVENVRRQYQFRVRHSMSPRQVRFLLRGGLINWMKERLAGQ
jgi:aconitase A